MGRNNERLEIRAPDVWALGEYVGPQFTYVSFDDFRIISRFACGKSTASNTTPASINAETNATLRASRSSLAMIRVAP